MNNKTIKLWPYDNMYTLYIILRQHYVHNIIHYTYTLHYIGGGGGRQIIIVDKMQIYYTNNETNH